MDTSRGIISELEDIPIETTQTEMKGKKMKIIDRIHKNGRTVTKVVIYTW